MSKFNIDIPQEDNIVRKERDFERSRDDVTNAAHTDYNRDIDAAKAARNSQKNDTNPYIEKEGYLGVDDLDKMRRRAVK